MKDVVSKEVAEKEVQDWLDFHEISQEGREAFASNISVMTRGIQSGRITIDPNTNELTQKLKHATGTIKELKYTSGGLPIGQIENNKTNINKDYENRNSLAHIAVATNTSTDILMQLSAKDLNTSIAIIIFFMV